MNYPVLSTLIFAPLVGGLALLLLPRENERELRLGALFVSLFVFFLSLPLWISFRTDTAALQFVESRSWIPSVGVGWKVGVDGISVLLVLLTTFLTPICILASWSVTQRLREYFVCFLVLESAMLGAFAAQDLLLFYVFWEAMLIPMLLLIGVWGGPGRVQAALKFFLFTIVGSLPMFIAILYLYVATGAKSFDIQLITESLRNSPIGISEGRWLFAAFALAFAVKVPLFPLHTWLPAAHVEAPTAGSVVLAGVLLKMGTYGFLRFAVPFFPEAAAHFWPCVMGLAVIGIVYGSLMCMAQDDMKKLIAYSSVAHLGFVVLGMYSFTEKGVSGAILQMVNHGISTGALFLCVGVLYERRHTRHLDDFGGLARVMPCFAVVLVVVTLSSIGLPGTNGFIGEFLILLGTFEASKWRAIVAASGVVLGAVYMLHMVQKVLFGKVVHEENEHLGDMRGREWATVLPLLVLVFVIGLFPGAFLKRMTASVRKLNADYHAFTGGRR